MHPQATELFGSAEITGGICVVDGYGLRIGVERRQLVIADGIGRARRNRRFARADRNIKRIVVIGNTGSISLDALRWLADVKLPLVHIDLEGRVLGLSALEGTDNPALRRAQSLAMERPAGLEIVRDLIQQKLQGQLRVAGGLLGDVRATAVIEAALEDLAGAGSLSEILTAEAVSASAYWPAWSEIPVRFARGDLPRIPAHWSVVGQRRSSLSQSARSAVSPAHAILNYCYALLAAEARVACLTMGLDPGLGLLHADKANRDSLVADLMEPVRPEVDIFLLDLLDRRTFRASDFVETRTGSCRVLAPLTHELAESATSWTRSVGRITEQVAAQFAAMVQGRAKRVSTPLTQSSRAAAVRQSVRSGSARSPRRRPRARGVCRTCGESTPRADYLYCEACRPARKAEQLNNLNLARAENNSEGALRHAAEDAESGRLKQRRAMERRNREARQWREAGGVAEDPSVFVDEILPLIQEVSTVQLSRATGLSRSYCQDVRRGKYVPHPRHWDRFRSVALRASLRT